MSRKQGIKKGSAEAQQNLMLQQDLRNARRKKEQMEHELWTMRVIKYIKQECIDSAQIALSNRFTFGPKRQAAFLEEFDKCFDEICHTKLQDTDDQYYSDVRIEGRLKECNGPGYIPKKDRYSFTLVDSEGREHHYQGVECTDVM